MVVTKRNWNITMNGNYGIFSLLDLRRVVQKEHKSNLYFTYCCQYKTRYIVCILYKLKEHSTIQCSTWSVRNKRSCAKRKNNDMGKRALLWTLVKRSRTKVPHNNEDEVGDEKYNVVRLAWCYHNTNHSFIIILLSKQTIICVIGLRSWNTTNSKYIDGWFT